MYQNYISGVVKNVIHFEETDSTNNQAKAYGARGEASGTLFVADRQTGGRGRRGRTWQSMDSDGLWMTLLIRPQIRPENASMLTLVAAMAVADALEDISKERCFIKWPNDIVVNGKKVCGILTEMSANPGAVDYVVIGIGINVNTSKFDDSIKDIATSLHLESGEHYDRWQVIAAFCKTFTKYYEKFLKTCDLSGLSDEYNGMLVNAGRIVKLEQAGQSLMGEAIGIDDTGALLVELTDGSRISVTAGEVSVRGLYGYV